MFFKRKFRNLFFFIFIIILFCFTPLYFVQAITIKIPRKKIPSFTINPESTNKLLPSVELSFELYRREEIEEGKNYYYKLIFKDDKLKKKLKNENKELKDLSFFYHLDVSILNESSDNKNLTDLFDIKCYQRDKNKPNAPFVEFKIITKSYKNDMYDLQSKPEQKRKFSLIDLKEWEYDIKIEVKTNSNHYKKYKELQDKKIKIKCELDITDKDNYPIYLFNLKDDLLKKDDLISRFDKFQNEKTSFQKMSKTNDVFYIFGLGPDLNQNIIYSIDYILNKDIASKDIYKEDNPIFLVFKQNDKFFIWDFISNKKVEYENKTYQELMDCHKKNKSEKKFESNLKSLRLKAYKKAIEFQKFLESKKESYSSSWFTKSSTKTDNDNKLTSVKANILEMEREDKTLELEQQRIINNTSETKKIEVEYELYYKNYIDFKKNKEYNIKKEFDNNNVSAIKLYFLKKIYDNTISDTYSSLHLTKKWDIDEIEYEELEENESFGKLIKKTLKRFEREFLQQSEEEQKKAKKFLDDNIPLSKGPEISDEVYLELEEENKREVDKDYSKNRGKHKNLKSIGNTDIKTLKDMLRTERNNKKKIKVTKIAMRPVSNSDFSLKGGIREYEPKVV
ncbi:hypothetical protein CWO85_02710 [Candidatus Phytoplasma ziziphi]|uniref:Uncharacterized protein n=1 Tax=Ziziphus jujuba witches'-broom phytoplasma TaxID=135727 RepID=A0A660HMW8_ZIZJU|nr:hypothetical protein [Candidatus Phytoplasma ziziphi]AYJ01400.1 hypothetical protein CWO85_02710 [Candidatus Phytoplasma ziziphi]